MLNTRLITRKKSAGLKILAKAGYFFAFILLVSFWLYHNLHHSNPERSFNLRNYTQNPQKFAGQYEQFGKIINISQDHFYFSAGGESIKVFGSGIKTPVYGETVIFVDYRKDGRIELIDYHNYNYNYILYALSLLALIIFIVIFFREWRITLRGFRDA